MWFFYYFNFKRTYDVLKSNIPWDLLKKKYINLIKTKCNWKWKIPQIVLGRRTLCFNSYKNNKSEVKLWWVGARERKKRAFFVPFLLPEGNYLKIYVLFHYIVYWIHFQNIHAFTYRKTLLHTLLLLVFKIVKSLSVSLIYIM